MRRLACVALLSLVFSHAYAESSWDTAFSILDRIELNVSELQTSTQETRNLNSDLATIASGQDRLLGQWQSIWNDSYNLLQTQQDSLERCEKSLKVYRTTTIILGTTTALTIVAVVLMGVIK